MKVRLIYRMRRLRKPGEEAGSCVMLVEGEDAEAIRERRRISPALRYRITARADKEALANGYDFADTMRIEPLDEGGESG